MWVETLQRMLPIIIGAFTALGIGMVWVIFGLNHPQRAVQGDPGAYIISGLIGVFVSISFAAQDRRITGLEKRIQELEERNRG
jgi:hypothetical protein